MIEFYIVGNQYHGEMTTYIADIIIIVCSILLLNRNRGALISNNRDENNEVNDTGVENCVQFAFVYCVAVIAMVFAGGTNFLTREGYVFGILSIFLVKYYSGLSYTASRRDLPNILLMTGIILAALFNIGSEFLLLLAQFF